MEGVVVFSRAFTREEIADGWRTAIFASEEIVHRRFSGLTHSSYRKFMNLRCRTVRPKLCVRSTIGSIFVPRKELQLLVEAGGIRVGLKSIVRSVVASILIRIRKDWIEAIARCLQRNLLAEVWTYTFPTVCPTDWYARGKITFWASRWCSRKICLAVAILQAWSNAGCEHSLVFGGRPLTVLIRSLTQFLKQSRNRFLKLG